MATCIASHPVLKCPLSSQKPTLVNWVGIRAEMNSLHIFLIHLLKNICFRSFIRYYRFNEVVTWCQRQIYKDFLFLIFKVVLVIIVILSTRKFLKNNSLISKIFRCYNLLFVSPLLGMVIYIIYMCMYLYLRCIHIVVVTCHQTVIIV